MPEERKAARLDFSDFKPRASGPTVDPLTQQRAIAEGKRVGFTARDEMARVDGRTLRRKGKVQINMKVSPIVQRELRLLIAEFPDADACMQHLIALHRQGRPT